MPRLLEDYALLADGKSAALVNRTGSIDWHCSPSFDSSSGFSALLGGAKNGSWHLGPLEPSETQRRYIEDTLVLETVHVTSQGQIRVTDFMPVGESGPAIFRRVEGLSGCVEICCELRLRFDYGKLTGRMGRDDSAIHIVAGPNRFSVYSSEALEGTEDVLSCRSVLDSGGSCWFALQHSVSSNGPPARPSVADELHGTVAFWTDWIGRAAKHISDDPRTRRSLVVLKGLIDSRTGGIVAAPTTSLPEAPAGTMNWDYRYSWIRDSSLSIAALIAGGFREDAVAWHGWVRRAIAGQPSEIQVLYRADGARRITESEMGWLTGFNFAVPVREGNAASGQLQLDSYGELINTFHLARRHGLLNDSDADATEHGIIDHVAKIWTEPDHGMWELRGEPRHWVYSKVCCWVAVDRYVRSVAPTNSATSELNRLKELRGAMHDAICASGFDPGLNSFVSHYGSLSVDASLLLLPILGFLPIEDPRIAATIRRIEAMLMRDGLVLRMEIEGPPPHQGAFLACSFWLADCYRLQGRAAEAREVFERAISCSNDLGLFAEEYDLTAKRLSGNYPLALTHLAHVNCAFGLAGHAVDRSE